MITRTGPDFTGFCAGRAAPVPAERAPEGFDTEPSRSDNASAMAEASEPPVVKLICGMISSRVELFDAAAEELSRAFGPIDHTSETMDFDFTHYYDEQMGTPLYRRFVGFAEPFQAGSLADAKLRTNAIEADFARRRGGDAPRPINLDPGYVEASKLVLASMKNFSHRIYLGRGVYAEVTLMFRRGRWEPLGWTFPDYRSGRYDAFLTAARERLAAAAKGAHR